MLSHLKKRFLAYFNKDGFDHMSGLVDPFEYHSLFHKLATVFAVMDHEKLAFWMHISPWCTIVSSSTAGAIMFVSTCEHVRHFNIHLLTECGTYLIVMLYKLIITLSLVRNRKHYHSLIRAMRHDYNYICTIGSKYRKEYFENQLLTFKASLVASILTSTMAFGMSVWGIFALIKYLIKHEEGENRPLHFPYWVFGYNLFASPQYEIMFVASLLFIFFHTYVYIFNLLSHIVWIRQIAGKADIIRWNLQDLLTDVSPANNKEEKEFYVKVIKHRMRKIIMMHQEMIILTEEYAAVFKKCLLYEQIIGGPVICLTAYCFAEKLDTGEVQGILGFLCLAVIWVTFVPSYMCTHLLEKTQSVGDACWDTPFWNAGPSLRPYLILIMQRSRRQLPLVAAGFADISLETYSNMLTRAYSTFNMLRQADFNFN